LPGITYGRLVFDGATQRSTGLIIASLLLIASASVMLASFQYVLMEMRIEFVSSRTRLKPWPSCRPPHP
jgi:hypothetical protein